MRNSRTLIPCTEETRDLVRAQKRRGETYETLLQKQQYNPKKAPSDPFDGATKQ